MAVATIGVACRCHPYHLIERNRLPMTIKIDSILVDVDIERNGQFIEIPEWPGVSLGVRSLELPAYKIALDVLIGRFARKYKGKNAPPVERDTEVGKLLAKHILFDWKGFEEPYSEEYALELLSSPKGRNLVKQTLWAATQVGETDIEFVEEATKNLLPPSATK